MAKRNMTNKGRATTVAAGVRTGKISQTGIRRELAAQRKAFGAKGVARAMKNWGLKAKTTKDGKIARGGRISSGRNG